MSEFRFICPFCDTPLDCQQELDGVETECPVCHAAIVPTISKDVFSECSEAEELRKEIDEQWEEFLQEQEQEQEQKQEIYPFIAKCPACKKVIELKEELKYSKQQCPFCNKTVILKTTKKQDGECQNRDGDAEKDNLNTLSSKKQYNTHLCRHCKNIIIIESTLSNNFACCPCCQKDVFLSKENIFFTQKDQSLEDFISLVKRKALQDNKRVFVLPPNPSINNMTLPKSSQAQDQTTGNIIGCLITIVILISLGSCIASCIKSSSSSRSSETPSSPVIHYSDAEKEEMKKTYLMLKEAEKRLEKRRKERAVENLVDIMDRGY